MTDVFSLAETAARLHKSERALQDWLTQNPVDAAGQPYACQLGKTRLFRESDIERLETVMRAAARRPTFIYFVEVEGHIKIGRSDNWRKRLSNIQSSCPFPARLLLVLKGSDGREKELHRLFAAHHVRGEWYRDHQDVRSFLELHEWKCLTRGLFDKKRGWT